MPFPGAVVMVPGGRVASRAAYVATTWMPRWRAERRPSRASERLGTTRAATETDRSPDGPRARAAQPPERMAVGEAQPGMSTLIVAPALEPPAKIGGIEPERLADVVEATGPVALLGAEPFLGFPEEPLSAPSRVGDVALESDDGFLQHGQEQSLLGDHGCIRREPAEQLDGKNSRGLELETTARRLAATATRCVH